MDDLQSYLHAENKALKTENESLRKALARLTETNSRLEQFRREVEASLTRSNQPPVTLYTSDDHRASEERGEYNSTGQLGPASTSTGRLYEPDQSMEHVKEPNTPIKPTYR